VWLAVEDTGNHAANGEGEPMWLTPHQRDSQPEGDRERERERESSMKYSGLCQTNPRGRRSCTTKSRKTEKEMDRRRQVQRGGLVAHGGGHRESCRMEKENPCAR